MKSFFVERPVFAIVISLLFVLVGLLSLNNMAMEQYPDIALPTVNISASYTGADAETIENSIVKVLEKELTGLDGLLYFSASSSSSGSASIRLTFTRETDPDTAQVQVQNKIQRATSRLPSIVQQNGVTVTKSLSNILMFVTVYDETGKATSEDVADYLVSNVQDPISRLEGIGGIMLIGQQYAMRIWLDADKLRGYNLMPSDVQTAIREQNIQLAAGKIGESPAPDTQVFTATVTGVSMLQTPEDFRNIVVKHETNGAVVRMKDVATVELGSESYSYKGRLNGKPAAGLGVQLASGANALATSELVHSYMAAVEPNLPDGYKIEFANDNSIFVETSIKEVVKTLLEAILLVVIVMYLFLGSVRATIIPTITVPIVMLGTFAVLWLFGFTINTLTLFAMVMAIGLLIDDTIVVVENVERLMHEQNLSPKQATIQSMSEVSGALIGIAAVISVVFIPMAFFSGSTGVIYRQFAITIVSSMLLSVVMALTLVPALCSMILRPQKDGKLTLFQRLFEKFTQKYANGVKRTINRPIMGIVVFLMFTVVASFVILRLPTGFLPNEDQGILILQYTLPEGAVLSRTVSVVEEIEKYMLTEEKDNVKSMFTSVGYSFSGAGQNTGMAFVTLKDWSLRKSSAAEIAARANRNLSTIRDARFFALVPPPIMGLGQTDGFEMYLQASGDTSRAELATMREQFIQKASTAPALSMVRADSAKSAPQLNIDIDNRKAFSYGLSLTNIHSTLNAAWAGVYVNDFIDRSRIKRVYIQGSQAQRSDPEDLYSWTVRNNAGDMVSFAEFSTIDWSYNAENLERFNGVAAYNVQGNAANGYSSGDAITAAENIVNEMDGASYAWSGLSFQEKISAGQAPMLYAISVLVVFLCLAALYESWSIPVVVLLVLPLGLVGTAAAVWMRGLENNIYFQIALLTTIGLTARNAIMMVEFADMLYRRGEPLMQAVVDAAILRIRPIMMTSLAFVAGIIPLAISSGVGANSRIAIGTGTIGGTITAALLAIFYIPLFFVLIQRFFGKKKAA